MSSTQEYVDFVCAQLYILDIDHRSEARKVVRILADVLPYPKPHKKQVSKKG